MTHALESVFPELVLHLPVVPPGASLAATVAPGDDEAAVRAGAIVAELACGEAIAHLSSAVVTPPELPRVLFPLRVALQDLAARTSSALGALAAVASDDASASVLPLLAPTSTSEQLRGFAVCDVYFRYRRTNDMKLAALAGQTAVTALQMIEDLPHSQMLSDDTMALLTGLRVQLGMLARGFSALPGPDVRTDLDLRGVDAWSPPWTVDARVGRSSSIAWWRLIVGHHHWNLLTFFARDAFDQTAAAFTDGNDEAGAVLLRQSAVLFRATTACMWFSSAFPIAFYHDVLRPTMEEGEAIDAQAQHISYALLKRSIGSMKRALETRHGVDRSKWPDLVFKAGREFAEIYVQDMEQHVRVAASKVGMDASLAQKVWQRELPATMRVKNAMDLLRDMATMRARDWR